MQTNEGLEPPVRDLSNLFQLLGKLTLQQDRVWNCWGHLLELKTEAYTREVRAERQKPKCAVSALNPVEFEADQLLDFSGFRTNFHVCLVLVGFLLFAMAKFQWIKKLRQKKPTSMWENSVISLRFKL